MIIFEKTNKWYNETIQKGDLHILYYSIPWEMFHMSTEETAHRKRRLTRTSGKITDLSLIIEYIHLQISTSLRDAAMIHWRRKPSLLEKMLLRMSNSHHEMRPHNKRLYFEIVRYYSQIFKYVVERLKRYVFVLKFASNDCWKLHIVAIHLCSCKNGAHFVRCVEN